MNVQMNSRHDAYRTIKLGENGREEKEKESIIWSSIFDVSVTSMFLYAKC